MKQQEPYFIPLPSNTELISLQIELDEYITAIAWLNNKNLAVGTAAGTLYFLDIETVKVLHKIKAHNGSVQSISTNNQNLIVTGGKMG
ncbi:MAG: hypothetical protein EAZ64_06445 [Sphingobacteriales bacterium]|nr:MAG: hypothetical protein EAZ64_06445 [Sphingobacteriales bacterium]